MLQACRASAFHVLSRYLALRERGVNEGLVWRGRRALRRAMALVAPDLADLIVAWLVQALISVTAFLAFGAAV